MLVWIWENDEKGAVNTGKFGLRPGRFGTAFVFRNVKGETEKEKEQNNRDETRDGFDELTASGLGAEWLGPKRNSRRAGLLHRQGYLRP